MERRIVEHAELTPGHCLLCGTGTGPFIECQTTEFRVATPNGPVTIEGTVYLCLGTEQNPGCPITLIEEIGGAGPSKLAALGDAMRARIGDLEDELETARELLEHAEANQGPRVVAVDELLAELTGRREERVQFSPAAPRLDGPPPPAWTPPAPPHPDSIAARLSMGVGLSGLRGELEGRGGATTTIE